MNSATSHTHYLTTSDNLHDLRAWEKRKNMSKYLELAKEQFFAMKKDILDKDRLSLGGAIEKEHEVDGKKCKINVDGFWEKSIWFEWEAKDMDGNLIEKGFWD